MNIMIIEDEDNTAEILQEVIESQSEYLVVKICESIEDSVKYLKKYQKNLDIIFMDIQLADGESFEIFKQVQITIPVIFCTTYDEFTLKAFKNNGIDYILKPIKEEEISRALAKVEQLKANFNHKTYPYSGAKNQLEQNFQTSFIVNYREKKIPILVADIALFYLNNEAAYLFNFKGEKFVIFQTLDQIENAVSPQQFFRINRQMIINRNAIKEIEPYFNRRSILQLTIPTPEIAVISRYKANQFIMWVENSK